MTRRGMVMSSIDESKKFVPLNIAVLTISDTRSLADDKSGTTLSERLTAAGHRLAAREIVVDDVEAIRDIIKKWIAEPDVDAIITTGGSSACRDRRAPAATAGTAFLPPSSITAPGPAILWRSCRGSMNICAARRRRVRRPDPVCHSGARPTGPREARPDDRLRREPGISRFPDVQLHI